MSEYLLTTLQDHCAPPEPEMPPIVYECHGCGEPIYDNQGYYLVNDETYCENCIERNYHTAYYEPDWGDDDD